MSLLAISAGVSIASSLLGRRADKKANKALRTAEDLAAKRSAIANVLNRRAAAAAIRRQQAQQQALAIASGMAGGSGSFATAGSIQSQGISALASQQQQIDLGADYNSAIATSNKYRGKSEDINTVGNIVQSGLSLYGDYTNRVK